VSLIGGKEAGPAPTGQNVEALQRERVADVREVHVVEEDVRFGLPRELEDIARRTGRTLPPRSGAAAGE